MTRSLQLFVCLALGAGLLLPGGCGATQAAGGDAAAGAPDGGGAELPSAGASSVGGTGGGAAATIPCLSDKVCQATGQLCDLGRQVCVDCRSTSDCSMGALCEFGSCVHVMSCKNSRDCGVDQVCNQEVGACVQCVTDADCVGDSAAACVNAVCHAVCKSDKDCVVANQLCDQAGGYCVDCVKDGDCNAGEYCVLSFCRPQACKPQAASCMGDQLLECDVHGGAYAKTSCVNGCSETGGAHCVSGGMAGAAGASAGGAGGVPSEVGAGGLAGEGGAGGSPACSMSQPDNVKVPSCGMVGASTKGAYTGIVTITVSGITQNQPGLNDDPFYELKADDLSQSTKACTGCVVFNRASEGTCLCSFECAAKSHYLWDLLVGPYPTFNPSHSYTVQVDLGAAPAEGLNFGYPDCGCGDNAGGYDLSVDCAP